MCRVYFFIYGGYNQITKTFSNECVRYNLRYDSRTSYSVGMSRTVLQPDGSLLLTYVIWKTKTFEPAHEIMVIFVLRKLKRACAAIQRG